MHKPAIEATKKYYAICVGINNYQDQALSPLRCAENDAQAMYDLLLARGFPKDHCCLLLGEQATTEAIYSALKMFVLTKPKKHDLILFYFAGHGLPICLPDDEEDESELASEVFLATTNGDYQHLRTQRGAWLEYPLRFGNLRSNFFERTTSKKVLFLLDSCHSGDFPGKAYRGETFSAQQWIEHSFARMSEGRMVLSSCMPQQKAYEDNEEGHGHFTYHLLQALNGQARNAARRDGWVTMSSLFDYLSKALPENQRPVESGVKHGSFELWYFSEFDEGTPSAFPHSIPETNQEAEKQQRLHALLADRSSFIHDRLSSFVGRQGELVDIGLRIQEKRPTGGYVTITGQAGQGKSSIIAKLVQEGGADAVAYHFIPFNPGPDHQVNVLRNLMARLILKYDLSDFYVASDQRAALRDYFPKVLAEVVAKGGQETIFIDGLDQLEEDLNGLRDLSFLPNDLPAGIVFVLGTRPDDTLRPLELLKPLDEYRLPNLSRQDFDLILQHRGVSLERTLADQFYQAMQQNALYLDLVAKELMESDQMSPQDLVAHLADNPSNLFSLSTVRLKRQSFEWREVLKPILGLLLAAREPLGLRQIRSLLQIEDDRLRDGIRRLGGLLADTGQQRYALFHLKLYDYLRQNEQLPGKDYIFATDEEEAWHAVLATWCEKGGLSLIWKDVNDPGEQERRRYARQHYMAHLYWARRWQDLFEVLDEGSYGHAKERYDVSTRSYLQDLDFGRQAAAWSGWMLEEALEHLPHLWRYTLLRCSLRSRADQYPLELFRLLLLLGREQEAVGHAELLTNPKRKALVLQSIAEHLSEQPTREAESQQLSRRAYEIACSISDSEMQAQALRELAAALVQAQRWEQAEEIARSISDSEQQAGVLGALAASLAQAQRWEQAERLWTQAEEVARSISDSKQQAGVLGALGASLAQAQRWEQAEEVARSISDSKQQAGVLGALGASLAQAQRWEQAEEVARSISDSKQQAWALRLLGASLAQAQRWEQAEEVARSISESYWQAWALSDLATALVQAQRWEQAEEVACSISESYWQAWALRSLGASLAQAQRWEQAERLWTQAEEVARSISNSKQQAGALGNLATALAQAQCWEQAEEVARSIPDSEEQAKALGELATALAQAGRWEQAEEVARSIPDSEEQAEALRELVTTLAQAQRWEQAEEVACSISGSYQQALELRKLVEALLKHGDYEKVLHIVQRSWLRVETRASALQVFSLAVKLISREPEMSVAFYQAFKWVDTFLGS